VTIALPGPTPGPPSTPQPGRRQSAGRPGGRSAYENPAGLQQPPPMAGSSPWTVSLAVTKGLATEDSR